MSDKNGPRVALLSDNSGLAVMCREICEEIAAGRADVLVRAAGAEPPAADHYIWDVRDGMELPGRLIRSSPERHLIVAAREDLAWLGRERLGPTMIVLKPATRPALSAFLAHALDQTEAGPNAPHSDREALLEALLQACLRLQEFEQERSTFLACTAHEFRVPLTAVTGYCGLLLSGDAGRLQPAQREIVSRLETSARRLSRLANGMQLLSMGQRAPALQLEPLHIRESVEQAVHECRLFLDEKQLVVEVELSPGLGRLWFERTQIDQVLINLIENACSHSERKGRIRIRAYPWFWSARSRREPSPEERRGAPSGEANSCRVDVFDEGPAMEEGDLSRIFEEYVTLGGKNARRGSGLGLAICRNILERHRGRIWAEPSPGGKQFCFVLPYRAEAFAAAGALLQAGAGTVSHTNENKTI